MVLVRCAVRARARAAATPSLTDYHARTLTARNSVSERRYRQTETPTPLYVYRHNPSPVPTSYYHMTDTTYLCRRLYECGSSSRDPASLTASNEVRSSSSPPPPARGARGPLARGAADTRKSQQSRGPTGAVPRRRRGRLPRGLSVVSIFLKSDIIITKNINIPIRRLATVARHAHGPATARGTPRASAPGARAAAGPPARRTARQRPLRRARRTRRIPERGSDLVRVGRCRWPARARPRVARGRVGG